MLFKKIDAGQRGTLRGVTGKHLTGQLGRGLLARRSQAGPSFQKAAGQGPGRVKKPYLVRAKRASGRPSQVWPVTSLQFSFCESL